MLARTIRSHPTFHIFGFGTNFLDYSYIFGIWTQNGPTFSSFSNLPTCKKTGPPKEQICVWTIPSYQLFVDISFFILYLQSFFIFFGKMHFLELLSYFNHFVYLRFKYRRPHIIIISKKNSYFKI